MSNKTILEIYVDRHNEKLSGAFEQILIILHNTLEVIKGKYGKISYINPEFSFEIAKIGNTIRFFVVCEGKFVNFLKNQLYAQYPNIEIIESSDYLENIPENNISLGKISLENNSILPIKSFGGLQTESTGEIIDPYSSLTTGLLKTGNNTLNAFIVHFAPLDDQQWKNQTINQYKFDISPYPQIIKKIILFFRKFSFLILPFIWSMKFLKFFFPKPEEIDSPEKESFEDTLSDDIKQKLEKLGFGVDIQILCASQDNTLNKLNIKEIFSPLSVFSFYGNNSLKLKEITQDQEEIKKAKQRVFENTFILSTQELSGLVHFPTTYVKTPNINWVISRNFEPPTNLPIIGEKSGEFTPIGKTNFRQEHQKFGISPSDRRRHMYIIGKTGMGKSTLLENMILDDIQKGRGVAVIDPHGDLAEAIIGNIPKSRTNQTIIFDPSDKDWPIAFNMLDGVSKEHRPLIASGMVGIFKKIFGESWGPRLEHTLRNTILALLEYPNTTLISIPLMLTSESYRNKVVAKITDPVVKGFWLNEYARMAPNQKVETAGPILNKVGQFLSSSILRNILGQPKNSFDLRWAMDNNRIVIINLSKGKIGEDASALLGSMMVTKFQMDAMSRADIAEKERKDFYLYVDEFQNFATDSFATILSEARKYKLNLVMANQYIDQMTESVKGAVFGNVGSIVSFQVGYHDGNIMRDVFSDDISVDDLTNLRKYSIYSKILIDGMPSKVFSADTFPPHHIKPEIFESRYKKILGVSREKYSTSKQKVEQKINKSIQDILAEDEKREIAKKQAKKDKNKG